MNQPAGRDFWKIVDQMRAARTPDEVFAIVYDAHARGVVGEGAVHLASRLSEAGNLPARPSLLALRRSETRLVRALAGQASASCTPPPMAPARVPTLWDQFAALPCGQQLAVIVVILLVALSAELPHEVQDQVWGMITTLGAAIWVIQRITRS
jgi:hypothetical protein